MKMLILSHVKVVLVPGNQKGEIIMIKKNGDK